MSSNMWNPVEDRCEVCGAEIGSEIPGECEEDGSPQHLRGSTIEDDNCNYLTVCQHCLGDIVLGNWEALQYKQEAR